jgi:hypothetical protein
VHVEKEGKGKEGREERREEGRESRKNVDTKR